jgi:iron(III) transport system permease protein
LFLFPLLVPSYVISVAWQHWLGPVGVLNKWTIGWLGHPVWVVAGLNGITVVLAVAHIPISYMLVRSALISSPAELEDAARIGGAGPWRVFTAVTLPLLIPACVSGTLLSFASAIDNFGIPAFIGIPSGVTVLSTLIYQKIIGIGAGSFEQAAALSVLTGLLAAVPVFLQGRLFNGPRFQREDSGMPSQPFRLGVWRWPLVVIVSLLAAFGVVGPFVAMAATSLTPAYGVPLSWSNITIAHYVSLWTEIPAVTTGFLNSLALAAGGTLTVLVLSWPLARAVASRPAVFSRILDSIAAIPYCLPGMVVGLATLLVWIKPLPGFSFSLYGGLGILLIAYTTRFLTFGVRVWSSAWARFAPALEEAGRIAGGGVITVNRRIILPLFRREAVGGALLVFLLSFTELTLSALLAGSGSPTIGLVIFNLESAGQALESAALGTLLTGFCILLASGVTRYLLCESVRPHKQGGTN